MSVVWAIVWINLMKIKLSISQQLILTMSLLNLAVIISSFIVGYLIYYIALKWELITIETFTYENFEFNSVDWMWILAALVSGSIFSIILGVTLSKRFAIPLKFLAQASQQISQGDLKARVQFTDQYPSEMIELLKNFNAMAEKLEQSVNNAQVWNAAIAHELRTPITILKGRLQGILDGVFQPEPQLIQNLFNQVESLSHLVEDLRTLTLYENQQLRLNIEETQFLPHLEKIILMFHEKLEKAKLNIVLEIGSQPVYCDQRRMEQVLIALLENTVRYSNAGSIKISSHVEKNDWVLTLEDEGPGIAQEHQEHLFKPFFRLEESRNRSSGGTGLGLAVICALIEAHAGKIEYLNENSHSIFKIVIPQIT